MRHGGVNELSERFTDLSDRFRSLWTFFQFLSGVYKHRAEGLIPYDYDFQTFYHRIQQLVPQITGDVDRSVLSEFETIEREIDRIHRELGRLESEFGPSYLRRFFDHLKRQDEKILFALVKFYLMSKHLGQETLDKLDILLTRLSEAPTDGHDLVQRVRTELLTTFERLAEFGGFLPVPPEKEIPLVEELITLRDEFERIGDFDTLVQSKVYDRLRAFKTRIGSDLLHPPILVEITAANIAAKNRFRELFEIEERHLLEGTNRVFDIERFLKKNPDLETEEIKNRIELFRQTRVKFEDARRQHNVKRSDILELRQSMHGVLSHFESTASSLLEDLREPSPSTDGNRRDGRDSPISSGKEWSESRNRQPVPDPPLSVQNGDDPPITSITDMLPSDPLLNEVLHKIMFALELVVWDRSPDQVTQAPEIKSLGLEPWEVETYRNLAEGRTSEDSEQRNLDKFFLNSAALRVKMEEERTEIERLAKGTNPDPLFEVLQKSASSLDRAREVERRFLWFIDDMLYRADTERLEQIYRSRFRFLYAFAGLWLDHQNNGGMTPL